MKPFIKVEWEDVIENFTPERIKRVKSYFQKKYNTDNIRIVTTTLVGNGSDKVKLNSLDLSDNILDSQYQKKLMKDFIKENNISTPWDLIDRLDNKVNSEIDKSRQNNIRYNKWNINKIEFSNFLSYGEDNVLDFKNLDGISVIESTPKNFSGKTTISCDLLLFLFFNTTTKTKTNPEIFNKFTDENEVFVRGHLTIDGEDFVISRTLKRRKTKIGDFSVKNELEFYKQSSDGTLINLTGEQRRETETFIVSAIGSEEDFLATILTTGNNLEELIESKPTARGQMLTKFLGLEGLKQKEEISKAMYNDWSKKLISNTHNLVDLENSISSLQDSIIESETTITETQKLLSDNTINLRNLEDQKDELLAKRNNNIDQELLNINPTALKIELTEIIRKKEISQNNYNNLILVEPSKYFNDDEYDTLKLKINGYNNELSTNKALVNQKNQIIKQLTEGKVCPLCKTKLEDVDHTSEINALKSEVLHIQGMIDEYMVKLENLNQKSKELDQLKKELDLYEKEKLRKERFLLESEQYQFQIDSINLKLDKFENGKKKLEENQKIDKELIILRTRIETINAEIRIANSKLERLKSEIIVYNEKIETNRGLIKKIKSEEEYLKVFQSYLSIYGKNGISKTILKNMIPVLNRELQRLLSDSCYFILELTINDKNEVDFLMIDTETRVVKPLASGSGYEKTISSLALRAVLTRISSLPKPNIIVMDEVFGKIADENLEMVGEFFKKIKNYFDHILLISHNPLIRNWSDNLIMVKKENNISSVDYISTKIS